MQAIEYSMTVLNQVVIMAILVAVGFFLTKAGKFSKKTAEDMTFVVFKIATPCTIIKSFLEVSFTAEFLGQIGMAVLLAALSHVVGWLYGFLFLKMKGQENANVYRFGSLCSNAGFIALPLAQETLSAESVLLVSVLAASAPSGSNVVQVAQLFDRDADYAATINILTCLFCAVTIPLMTWFYQWIV